MCGIAGYADFKRNTGQETLTRMTNTMEHRGPDATGIRIYQEDGVEIGFGHRRLSILDLTAAGNQPMSHDQERYWIVFNGEVYNFEEVKTELASKGHSFHSHSDTEMILHAYQEWGPSCLGKFVGMFAFVIYDKQRHQLFCARDRAGVKPFIYYWKDGLFLFTSEIKAFMEHPRFGRKLNLQAVRDYFKHGYIPGAQCIFQDAFKLPPGHYMTVDLTRGVHHIEKYWDVISLYEQEKLKIGLPEAIEETERILVKAFQYRMVADVPIGVFLSGGYDSALLTALLQKDMTQKLKTFTIGFQEDTFNEAHHARAVAEKLGTDHTEYYCTEQDALDLFPQLSYYFDEPFSDSSALPTLLVSKLAREKVTVALSADAGDESFAGYDRYMSMLKNQGRFGGIPAPLRAVINGVAGLSQAGPILDAMGRFSQLKKFGQARAMLRDPGMATVYEQHSTDYSDAECSSLFRKDLQASLPASELPPVMPRGADMLAFAMANDYQRYMVDDILVKVDKAGMAVSLEGREPLLDHHIIAWAAQLPNDMKVRDGQRKYILKQIVHKYLPASMMDRPKKGFAMPMRSWLQGSLRPMVDHYLGDDYLNRQGMFDPAYVNRIKKSFYGHGHENVYKIWHLLMFQMWYDRWVAGNDTRPPLLKP